MNSKAKLALIIHLIVQIISQTAIVSLAPAHYQPLFAATAAFLGVLAAFFDTTNAKPAV